VIIRHWVAADPVAPVSDIMVPETAQQLAWHKGRDNPNQEDWREAAEFVARHRKKRQQLGLRPWPYE